MADDYNDNEASLYQKGKGFLLDFMQSSAIGRGLIEVVKMSVMLAIFYMVMCTVGELILFGIKFLKVAIGTDF